MAVNITLNAGDEVFWLSSKGFVKGKIKKIHYSEELLTGNRKYDTIKYFLVHSGNSEEYQGEEVKPDNIFKSYKEMLEYYSKNEPK